jgi:hypothetical protein
MRFLNPYVTALMLATINARTPAERAKAKADIRAILGGRGSGGHIRRALNLANMPAFNEYRVVVDGELDADQERQNRNAAKARRRALRAQGVRL